MRAAALGGLCFLFSLVRAEGPGAPDAQVEALAVIERFAEAFNRGDAAAMDATLHFPHFFPGPRPLVWEKPGSLAPDFFEKLRATGWTHSRFIEKQVVLVSPEKVHVKVVYTRNGASGQVLETHHALWIVTRLDGRWGIQSRSAQ